MTTNNTETTKQRIFIHGVEHRFRVGEKMRIRHCAAIDKPDEDRGDTVTIRDYAPICKRAGYHVAPHGGWYEEYELEAMPEAAAPAHGLKVGDIVRFRNQAEYEGWNGYRIAKDWGLGSRIGVSFRVKAVPAHGKSVVLDTPFSGGKGTGCKVKRIVKSLYNDETATQKAMRPMQPRFKIGDKVVLKAGEKQNYGNNKEETLVPGAVYTVTGTAPRDPNRNSMQSQAQFYVALSTSDGRAHGDDHWETSLELAKTAYVPGLAASSLSDLVDRYYQIALEEHRQRCKDAPKPSSKFFLVLSEENEPGGTFDNYTAAWSAAVKLAKEPGAVPYYVFEVKAKVTPKVTRTVDTETTTY